MRTRDLLPLVGQNVDLRYSYAGKNYGGQRGECGKLEHDGKQFRVVAIKSAPWQTIAVFKAGDVRYLYLEPSSAESAECLEDDRAWQPTLEFGCSREKYAAMKAKIADE